MLQLHKTWRNIMRQQSVQELRRDIMWISQKHVHEVNFLSYAWMDIFNPIATRILEPLNRVPVFSPLEFTDSFA